MSFYLRRYGMSARYFINLEGAVKSINGEVP